MIITPEERAHVGQIKRACRPLMAFGATINSANGREPHFSTATPERVRKRVLFGTTAGVDYNTFPAAAFYAASFLPQRSRGIDRRRPHRGNETGGQCNVGYGSAAALCHDFVSRLAAHRSDTAMSGVLVVRGMSNAQSDLHAVERSP